MNVDFIAELTSSLHGGSHYLHLSVPQDESAFLRDLPIPHGGFGSIRVDATIGRTTWRTSVFPDRDRYLLLVSKRLARAEGLDVGEPVPVNLEVVIED